MTPVLEIIDLSYSTPNGRPLTSHLSLSARSGDLVLISGPNGSGKTTLLRILLGELQATRGSLKLAITRQHIEYLPQLENKEFHLPLTLEDVLALPKLSDLNKALGFGLLTAEKLKLHWNTASGGERKKALLTRALLGEPELLVLDEPMNHLDPESRKTILEKLEDFLRGTPPRLVIMVSHRGLDFEEIKNIPIKPLTLTEPDHA